VGDAVTSWDFEQKRQCAEVVLDVMPPRNESIVEIRVMSDGSANISTIRCTASHPFWVPGRGWASVDPELGSEAAGVPTVALLPGDRLLTRSGGAAVVAGIVVLDDVEEVYNFHVNRTNNYFAAGVLAHNKGGSSCFTAGTPITLADGSSKDVARVQVGDAVTSWDFEQKRQCAEVVLDVMPPRNESIVEIRVMSDGSANISTIRCTASHPFWVPGRGWASVDPELGSEAAGVPTVALLPGDRLLTRSGGAAVVAGIVVLDDVEEVYNFHVNRTNNYFAAGVLAHNKGSCTKVTVQYTCYDLFARLTYVTPGSTSASCEVVRRDVVEADAAEVLPGTYIDCWRRDLEGVDYDCDLLVPWTWPDSAQLEPSLWGGIACFLFSLLGVAGFIYCLVERAQDRQCFVDQMEEFVRQSVCPTEAELLFSPPSGSWSGEFVEKGLTLTATYTLRFDNLKISGHGRDRDGKYKISKGMYSPDKRRYAWLETHKGGLVACCLAELTPQANSTPALVGRFCSNKNISGTLSIHPVGAVVPMPAWQPSRDKVTAFTAPPPARFDYGVSDGVGGGPLPSAPAVAIAFDSTATNSADLPQFDSAFDSTATNSADLPQFDSAADKQFATDSTATNTDRAADKQFAGAADPPSKPTQCHLPGSADDRPDIGL